MSQTCSVFPSKLFNSEPKIHKIPHHAFTHPSHSQIRCKSLSVKLLLVRLHVDVALELSAGSSELEAKDAFLGLLMHVNQADHAAVLQRVLETGSEVRNELVDRTKK